MATWKFLDVKEPAVMVLKCAQGFLVSLEDNLLYIEDDHAFDGMILDALPEEPPVEPPIEPEEPVVDPPIDPEPPVEPETEPPVEPEPEPPVEPEPEPVFEYLSSIVDGVIQPGWNNYSWSCTPVFIPGAMQVTMTGSWGGFNLNHAGQTHNLEDYDQVELEITKVSGPDNLYMNIINNQTDRQSFALAGKSGLVILPITQTGTFTNTTIKNGSPSGAVFEVKSLRLRKKAVVTLPPGEVVPPVVPPDINVAGWMRTSGNKILDSDGTTFFAKGANIFDTRSCGACASNPPNVAEVKRRIDFAVSQVGLKFLRLCLEATTYGNGLTAGNILVDPQYRADVKEIVDYIGTKAGVKVLVSVWSDPSLGNKGRPNENTNNVLKALVQDFSNHSYVMFGVCNEPEENWNGAEDASVWQLMNSAVESIRAEEARLGTPAHIVSVQGTRAWARSLSYYISHPITAAGGVNVVYETHIYDSVSEFNLLLNTPAATLPVIVGEFGPAVGYMTQADCNELMVRCKALNVPFLAWAFHMRCDPNMLVDNSGGSCGVGMTLQLTPWGDSVKNFA